MSDLFFSVKCFFILVAMTFSGSLIAGESVLPSVSVKVFGDYPDLPSLERNLTKVFDERDICLSKLVNDDFDFELYVEIVDFDGGFVLSYTVLQPFMESIAYKILGVSPDFSSKARRQYANRSRVYVSGWVSVINKNDVGYVAEKICADYSKNVEKPVL